MESISRIEFGVEFVLNLWLQRIGLHSGWSFQGSNSEHQRSQHSGRTWNKFKLVFLGCSSFVRLCYRNVWASRLAKIRREPAGWPLAADEPLATVAGPHRSHPQPERTVSEFRTAVVCSPPPLLFAHWLPALVGRIGGDVRPPPFRAARDPLASVSIEFDLADGLDSY